MPARRAKRRDELCMSDSDYCESCDSYSPSPKPSPTFSRVNSVHTIDTHTHDTSDDHNYANAATTGATMPTNTRLQSGTDTRKSHAPVSSQITALSDGWERTKISAMPVPGARITAHDTEGLGNIYATDWSVFWVPTTGDIAELRDLFSGGMLSEPYLRTLKQVSRSSRVFAEQFRPYISCDFDEATGMPLDVEQKQCTDHSDEMTCDGYVYFTSDSKPVKSVKENGNLLVVVRGLLGDEKATLTICRLVGNRLYPKIMEMDGVRGSWGVNVLACTYACPEDIEVLQSLLMEENKCNVLKPMLYPAECRARLIESMSNRTEGLSPVRAFLQTHGLSGCVDVLGQDEMEQIQGEMIGDGTFGAVYMLKKRPNHVLKLFKPECNAEDRLNEIMCLGALQGVESVPKLFAVVEAQFEDEDEFMEMKEGLHFMGYVCTRYDYTLLDYHKENPNASDVYNLLRGLVVSLLDIHRQRICHLDLCDRNVMITRPPVHKPGATSQLKVSIIDFAGACLLPQSMLFLPNPLIAKCTYRPPEIFKARAVKAGEVTGILPITQARALSVSRNKSSQVKNRLPAPSNTKRRTASHSQTRTLSQSPTESQTHKQTKIPLPEEDSDSNSERSEVNGNPKAWIGYVEVTDESSSESEVSESERKSANRRFVDGRKLDVWGMGVIFTEVLTRGIKAWGGTFDAQRLTQIVSSENAIKRYIEESVQGPTWRELLGGCLAVKPSKRWLCDEILDFMIENRDQLMEELKGLPVKSGARTKKSRQLDKYQDTSMLNPKSRKHAKHKQDEKRTERRGKASIDLPEKTSNKINRSTKPPGPVTTGKFPPLPVPIRCLEPEHYMIARKLGKIQYTHGRLIAKEEHVFGAASMDEERQQTVCYERAYDPAPRHGQVKRPGPAETYYDMTSEEDGTEGTPADEEETRKALNLQKMIERYKRKKAKKVAEKRSSGPGAVSDDSTILKGEAEYANLDNASITGLRADESPAVSIANRVIATEGSSAQFIQKSQGLIDTNPRVSAEVLAQGRLDSHRQDFGKVHSKIASGMPPLRTTNGKQTNLHQLDPRNFSHNQHRASFQLEHLPKVQAISNTRRTDEGNFDRTTSKSSRFSTSEDLRNSPIDPTRQTPVLNYSNRSHPYLYNTQAGKGHRATHAYPPSQIETDVARIPFAKETQPCVYSGTRGPAHPQRSSYLHQPLEHVSQMAHKKETNQRTLASQVTSSTRPLAQPRVISGTSMRAYEHISDQHSQPITQIRKPTNNQTLRYQQNAIPRYLHPYGPADGTG